MTSDERILISWLGWLPLSVGVLVEISQSAGSLPIAVQAVVYINIKHAFSHFPKHRLLYLVQLRPGKQQPFIIILIAMFINFCSSVRKECLQSN